MKPPSPAFLLLSLSSLAALTTAQSSKDDDDVSSATSISRSLSAPPSTTLPTLTASSSAEAASPEATAGFFSYLFIGYPDCSIDCMTSAYTAAQCPADSTGNCPCQWASFLSRAGSCVRSECKEADAEEALELQKRKCARKDFDEETWQEGVKPSGSVSEKAPEPEETEEAGDKGGAAAMVSGYGGVGAGLSAVMAVAFGLL
ncbi:hypothetical protein EX30DRAFT_397387 [Ascodesmis nigricans]|uniref:CFEM domain-containing protein n=1 Tax=Ascodesmis nigricans TaxID=341454 RepID=A0A4S2MPF4_9PEZI|nr:hypothetical protein EX30DRAFT_397387 [Ascodesmis nigricans]